MAKVVAKVVAKPEVEPHLPLLEDDEFEDEQAITTIAKGWRLELNSNNYYRWRWQLKDSSGKTITYVASSGKTGYKRGSKYVGKKQ